MKLLLKMLKTDVSILEYLDGVVAERTNEYIERDAANACTSGVTPTSPQPIPAKNKKGNATCSSSITAHSRSESHRTARAQHDCCAASSFPFRNPSMATRLFQLQTRPVSARSPAQPKLLMMFCIEAITPQQGAAMKSLKIASALAALFVVVGLAYVAQQTGSGTNMVSAAADSSAA